MRSHGREAAHALRETTMSMLAASLGSLWEGSLSVWKSLPLVLTALIICTLYAAGIIAARWLLVARPTRRFLEARLDEIQSQLKLAEATHPSAPTVAGARELLDKAARHLGRRTTFGWFSWSGENELAAWRDVHGAERMLIMTWPETQVQARLAEVVAELKALPQAAPAATADDGEALDLVALIRQTLKLSPREPEKEKHLLERAFDTLYSDLDFNFWQLANRYSKAMWMTGSALLLIIAVAFIVGNPVFLLAGAVGGFMSRLSRALKEETDATDYSAFWTTLFLSPLLGALTGWSGVLLLSLGTELGVLGDAFGKTPWTSSGHVAPLAAAFLFGFSERFFYGVVSKVESSTEDKKTEDKKAAPAPPAPQPATTLTPSAPRDNGVSGESRPTS
jgi:hypothetical protein